MATGAPQERIYLDAMAASPLDPRVKEVVCAVLERYQGNPNALHTEGRQARAVLERARERVARAVEAAPPDVIFTSGGSEGNTLAIWGFLRALRKEGALRDAAIAVLDIEHASVLEAAKAAAEEYGVVVHQLPVDGEGVVQEAALREALQDPRLKLLSLVAVNNEVGTVQPMAAIAQLVRAVRQERSSPFPLFHTDASQAPAVVAVSLRRWGVDAMTLDAQKVYGPKGVGALVRSRAYPLAPVIYGGSQEFRLRGGTQNVPLIAGFAEALRLVAKEREQRAAHMLKLSRLLWEQVQQRIPRVALNGPPIGSEHRAANNLNVSFLGVEGEYVVLGLDARGIAVSTRSACHLPDAGGMGSEVVFALTRDPERARSAVRFSVHPWLQEADVARVVQALAEVVAMGRGAIASEEAPSV